MTEGDIFDVVNPHSRQGRLACIHLRSVRGEVPFHEKMFIDDGDADAMGALRIHKQNRFVGVIIPGQAPQLACLVPWRAGRNPRDRAASLGRRRLTGKLPDSCKLCATSVAGCATIARVVLNSPQKARFSSWHLICV